MTGPDGQRPTVDSDRRTRPAEPAWSIARRATNEPPPRRGLYVGLAAVAVALVLWWLLPERARGNGRIVALG